MGRRGRSVGTMASVFLNMDNLALATPSDGFDSPKQSSGRCVLHGQRLVYRAGVHVGK